MLAPPTNSQPLLRRARGPLSVPCGPGTPVYRLQAKTKGMTHAHVLPCVTAASEPTSCLGRTMPLPRVLGLQTPTLHMGGLWCYHVSWGSGPRLIVQEGSGAAMCPLTPDPASPPRRTPALTRVLPQRWAPVLTRVPCLSAGRGPKR
jgi:hypothetical protein